MPWVAGMYPNPGISAATLLTPWGVLSCLAETEVHGGSFYHQAAAKNLVRPFLKLLDILVHTC